MVAVGLEAYIRGINMEEHCFSSPLSVFLLAQVVFIIVIQIVPQMMLMASNKLLSAGVAVRWMSEPLLFSLKPYPHLSFSSGNNNNRQVSSRSNTYG
jgi:hypothetical protein